ncbi:serine hydroxymethyltransferase [Candidatus Saccharibacteria bacterium RIFCSPHIGHO2_12_FULL_42_8]|nr:MAG: serine hydroxymethyltransferase [Candidatus Saccharibacteria bacterium RIFCSPHIGHO2_12_FULL_42_8]
MKDKEIEKLIEAEKIRQRSGLELIPSENYVSEDVLTALGSVFTNKYSEGYPGKRYYGGQENTDQLETIAIERAKKLFGADHANVQPHSGAQANEAVYHAWCEPGDTIIAMDLSHGGHLTHGHPVTILAKQFNFVRYGIKDISTGEIDYDSLRELALKHKPKIILAGFSAYPRELDYAKFAAIGEEVGALLVADMSHIAGLIAGGVAKNPFDYGFHVITTTTHKTLRGPRAGLILSKGIAGNPLKKPDHTIENIPTLIDRTVFPGLQGGPHMHVIAAKAVAFREASQPEFKVYARQIVKNANAFAQALKLKGFELVTGGTDNHLILANVKNSFDVDGDEVQRALDSVGITVNKNAVPDDTLPAFKPSGIRLGTPAITTHGMKEKDMQKIADLIYETIVSRSDSSQLNKIRQEVLSFVGKF